MKKILITLGIIALATSVSALSITNVPSFGSWSSGRKHINASFESITNQLGAMSVTGVDGAWTVGGDVTLENSDYIDNSTATAVVLGYPTRRTTGGETNIAQLILYSADTNVTDDIVADIASVRAYNDSGTNVAYASIRAILQDVSGGSEDADVATYIKVAGVNTAVLTVNSAGITVDGTVTADAVTGVYTNSTVSGTLTAADLVATNSIDTQSLVVDTTALITGVATFTATPVCSGALTITTTGTAADLVATNSIDTQSLVVDTTLTIAGSAGFSGTVTNSSTLGTNIFWYSSGVVTNVTYP